MPPMSAGESHGSDSSVDSGDENRTEYVGAYVTPSERDDLDDIAWESRVNRSELMRVLVYKLLNGDIDLSEELDVDMSELGVN